MYANTYLWNMLNMYVYLGTDSPPTKYEPLSYANHTVTVEGRSGFGIHRITHQGITIK